MIQIRSKGERSTLIEKLKEELLGIQRLKPSEKSEVSSTLAFMSDAFPNRCFPTGVIHELVTSQPEEIASSLGFISGVISSLVQLKGVVIWIGPSCSVFPPALRLYGLCPEHTIFITLGREQDALWVMEEALKCEAVAVVVGEINKLDFTTSRRLQLAVERSRVTGFVLRRHLQSLNTTASVSRWRISPIPSEGIGGLPGVGYPSWHVELLRMRNGKARSWDVYWRDNQFHLIESQNLSQPLVQKKAM